MALRQFVDQDVPGPRRDYVGYGPHVPRVRWPDGARIAVNIVLNYEEGSEYTHAAGDGKNDVLTEIPYVMEPAYRDLAAESVYEYGARAGVWRVQRLVDGLGLPITFFAAATALERNPEVAAWIREAGHEPCSHGWRWEEVWRLGRETERRHMQWAIESFEETVGQRPLGWYCRYGPSVHTRELLVEEGGFVYDADAYNDDLPYFTEVLGRRHLIVPYTFTYNDARWFRAGAGLRLTGRLRDHAQARLRHPLGGRGGTPPHDVDRPPPSLGRPGRPHRRSARLPRIRTRQGRRLVRPAHRYRRVVACPPRGVQALIGSPCPAACWCRQARALCRRLRALAWNGLETSDE